MERVAGFAWNQWQAWSGIRKYVKDRGFGFILDDFGTTHFFHMSSQLDDTYTPVEDDIVEFTPIMAKSGKHVAKEVKLLQLASFSILEEIEKWDPEASHEDMIRYFYKTPQVDKLETGSRWLVLGRKGSGKTAIVEHIESTHNDKRFTSKLSFQNFPFKELYSLENQAYSYPNQYITLWKFVIYTTIAEQMLLNKSIPIETRERLEPIFGKTLSRTLPKKLRQLTAKKLGASALGFSGSLESGSIFIDNESSWIERTEVLEEFLLDNIDQLEYFVLFDSLDDDFSALNNEKSMEDRYFSLLSGLLKAVHEIRGIFPYSDYGVRTIVCLRTDIYSLVRDSEKPKWTMLATELIWTNE